MEFEEYEQYWFVGGPADGQQERVEEGKQTVLIPDQARFLGATAAGEIRTVPYRLIRAETDPGTIASFYASVDIDDEQALQRYQQLV